MGQKIVMHGWHWCCLVLFVVAVSGGLPERAQAHPHVFVENGVELVFDANGMTGLKVRWEFDALASSQYIMDLDTNGDGKLTPAEWKAERDDIAGFLSEERFFIYAMVNGKMITIPAIRDFVATHENGVLVYSFFAPLVVPRGNANVILSVYDPSYYTDFQTVDEGISLSGNADGAQYTLNDAPELAFYNGQIIPIAVRVQF